MILKDIKIHQDPQILIQMVLDKVLNQASGTSISIPIIMINVITSNGAESKVEAQSLVASDGQIVSDEILETWQACRYLKISKPIYLMHVNSGRINASKVGGRGWKVFKSELDRFLKES